MARYIATSGSNFDPFSYDELVKPIQQMADMHAAVQDAYDTLDLETNALGQYITEHPGDSKARSMYNSYMTKLNTLQNNLWEHGLNAQTRRELSAARRGYASNIKPLADAIKNRQERSAAYWTMRHNNPDMIMGEDPGLSGLDMYLADTNYGQDYYNYSGRNFMDEVGIDAKARADELLRDPEIQKNADLQGILLRIKKEGFTSEEVRVAGDAVEAVLDGQLSESALGKLSGPEQVLADVLLSHVRATGAQDKVSKEEFKRLLGYGRSGLSQAIGRTTEQVLEDNVWKEQHEWNMFKRKTEYKPSNKTGGDKPAPVPYSLDDISSYMEAANAKRINETLGDKWYKPFEKPIVVKDSDGNASVISSPYDAEAILNSFGRSAIKDYYGVNPDRPVGTWIVNNGGKEEEIRVDVNSVGATGNSIYGIDSKENPYIVFTKNDKGEFVPNEDMTTSFNTDLAGYKENLKNWEKENKGVNLKKLAISDKERQKIYDQYDIPEDIAFEDIPYILEAKSKQGRVTRATIAGATGAYDSTRENYAKQLIASFSRAAGNKDRVEKTSEAAFYPVKDYDISEEGEGDIKKVFGTVGNSDVLNAKTVSEVTVLPEDLVKNRVRVSINGKEYAVNPAMLGNDVDYQIQAMRSPVISAMVPILDPVAAMRMGPTEAANWTYTTGRLLGDYLRMEGVDEDGGKVYITPRDIVMNPELRSALRTAIVRFMDNVLADARDNMMQNNMQTRGNSSSNATGYNAYTE